MPEEINRILTDQIADLLFTPSADGDANLLREGVALEKIHLVGNVMIDTLVRLQELATDSKRLNQVQQKYLDLNNQDNSTYALVTLHRPSNVDNREVLIEIIKALEEISKHVPILFPIHPRTREHLRALRLEIDSQRLRLTDPVGYLEFLSLQKGAAFVITDSGGIQEETTFLGIPCLTVRENTERPITVELGTNILVGQNMDRLKEEVHNILNGRAKKGKVPPLWDGKAGERIAEVISEWGQ
jgi:UDP-N-acetylglucosamine 2-epimerase (non-hydrolysing)